MSVVSRVNRSGGEDHRENLKRQIKNFVCIIRSFHKVKDSSHRLKNRSLGSMFWLNYGFNGKNEVLRGTTVGLHISIEIGRDTIESLTVISFM